MYSLTFLANELIDFVMAWRRPSTWDPPSRVLMPFANPRVVSVYVSRHHCKATSTVTPLRPEPLFFRARGADDINLMIGNEGCRQGPLASHREATSSPIPPAWQNTLSDSSESFLRRLSNNLISSQLAQLHFPAHAWWLTSVSDSDLNKLVHPIWWQSGEDGQQRMGEWVPMCMWSLSPSRRQILRWT